MRLSIIIPTFNRAALIGRAIESAFQQAAPDDEIIVVDDGSTDDTRSIVQSAGGQVRYLHQENQGVAAARNHGLREATADLVAFLDSDDEWMPGKLQLQRQFMSCRPDVVFCFSNFAVTLSDGAAHHSYLAHWLHEPQGWPQRLGSPRRFSTFAKLPVGIDDFDVYIAPFYAAMLTDGYILTSSLMVRREAAGETALFSEELPIYEDWYYFAKIAQRGLGAYFDCETAWQHGHCDVRVSDADALLRARSRIRLLESVWGDDASFLQDGRPLYEAQLHEAQVALARAFIAAGQTREARRLLDQAGGAPRSLGILARMPGPVARALSQARRRVLASLKSRSTR
jgi:glycosyltransferase involved in cell wall biosynthesis